MTSVWVLSSNRWNSAITEYALSLARAAKIAGCDVVFTPLAGSPAEARARSLGLDVRPLPHFGIGAARVAARIAEGVRADAVVACGGPETVLTMLPAVRRGARVVRFRGQEVEPRALGELRHKLAHAHVDAILTPSERLAASVRVLDAGREVRAVTLGVDTERFRRTVAASQVGSGARPEVVILGRFDPVKGHAAAMDLLRAALATEAGARLRPCLHIVGEPANLSVAHLEGFARERGLRLGDDVRITARRVEDVAALLSGVAVGLVPSLGSEIICRVAEEFLVCGTPVVVSGVGSLGETLAFDGAGGSYGGMDASAAAGLLMRWVDVSVGEGEAAKVARAAAAVRCFGLPTMAAALMEFLR